MAKRQLSRLPWITREGYVDMLRIPLESTYAAAVSADPRQVRNALRVLQSAAGYGRTEASLFLMGFFVSDLLGTGRCESRLLKLCASAGRKNVQISSFPRFAG